MANICQAFSRIMPRYEFDTNLGLMAVEDLDHSLGRTPMIGYPPRYIGQGDPLYRRAIKRFPCQYCTPIERCRRHRARKDCYCC